MKKKDLFPSPCSARPLFQPTFLKSVPAPSSLLLFSRATAFSGPPDPIRPNKACRLKFASAPYSFAPSLLHHGPAAHPGPNLSPAPARSAPARPEPARSPSGRGQCPWRTRPGRRRRFSWRARPGLPASAPYLTRAAPAARCPEPPRAPLLPKPPPPARRRRRRALQFRPPPGSTAVRTSRSHPRTRRGRPRRAARLPAILVAGGSSGPRNSLKSEPATMANRRSVLPRIPAAAACSPPR
jgi:hypothetical protein